MASSSVSTGHARDLSDVVTRLRRALRRSIRTDYPWESRPMAQIEVLQSVRDSGTTRIGDLAVRLRLAQSTVSALVSRLVADGLLVQAVDSGDRRASVVDVADAGRQHLQDWDDAHRRRIAAAFDALPRAERQAVMSALPALSHLVDVLNAQGHGVGSPGDARGLAGYSSDMATTKQRQAAERNVKSAQRAARSERTIDKLPRSTRTALGKQGAAVAQRKRTGGSSPKTRAELYELAKRRDLPGRSKMGRDELARALHVD